ncbi:MAG: hypothetical protein ACFCVE_01615 [Phycisphaerae bacterium]
MGRLFEDMLEALRTYAQMLDLPVGPLLFVLGLLLLATVGSAAYAFVTLFLKEMRKHLGGRR